MRSVRSLLFTILILGSANHARAQDPELPRLLTEYGVEMEPSSGFASGDAMARERVVGLALKFSPRLKALEHDITALGFSARQARVFPNPVVSVSVEDWGRRKAGGFSQTTIGVEQTILLWGKRARAFDAIEARRLSAKAEWQAEALDLYARASSLYAALLGGQEKLVHAAKRLELARATEEAVTLRSHAGGVPESEVLRAAASRSLAQIDSLSAASEIESAWTRIGALLGMDRIRIVGTGDLRGAERLPLPDSLGNALKTHPLAVALAAEREALSQEARLARALGKPSVAVAAGYRRLHDAADNSVVLGVSMPFPFRNPNTAGIAASDARIDAADARLQEVMIALESDVRTLAVAWEQRTAEIAMIETQTLPAIERSLTSLDMAYRVGQQPYMNLLDVQRTQSELQTRLVDAMVEKAQLESRLESLLGQRIDTTER